MIVGLYVPFATLVPIVWWDLSRLFLNRLENIIMAITTTKNTYDNSKSVGVFAGDIPFGFLSLTVTKDVLLEQQPNLANDDFKFTKPRNTESGKLMMSVAVAGVYVGNYFPAVDITLDDVKVAKAAGDLTFAINQHGRKLSTEELAEAF